MIGASHLEVSGNKAQRGWSCAVGYEYNTATFKELANLLSLDLAYSPFKFKNGKRGRAEIISGTEWIVFDVDKTSVEDTEMHLILHEYQHHIARTSNPTNAKKYRIIMRLSEEVKIGPEVWKYFIASIGGYLNIPFDKLGQAQISFGYKDRNVLSQLTGKTIDVSKHLVRAKYTAEVKEQERSLITPEAKARMVKSPYTTFESAYEIGDKPRSLTLYSTALQAYNIGMTKIEIKKLLASIVDFWCDKSFTQSRLDNIYMQIDGF